MTLKLLYIPKKTNTMKIYIYGLYEKDNIRYVGKTNKKDLKIRLKEHINESFRENSITHKKNWIKSVIKKGDKIDIKLIEITDENNWQNIEKYWISYFKNLTNSTEGGETGRGKLYTISYEECKEYIKRYNIKSKYSWFRNINKLPNFIPLSPREVFLNNGWVSWGDFLGTNRIQDNKKTEKYISYNDAKKYIKENLNEITTLKMWKEYTKNNKIPEIIPNRPERYYNNKNRGWISWGDFLGTGRIANQHKKEIFLSYKEAKKYIYNKASSIKEFHKKRPENIPSNPDKYYKEWKSWCEFLGTNNIQDNKKSKIYLNYNDAKKYIKENLNNVRTQNIWKEYVKNSKIPKIIPNHPELFYNRKNRGWLGWKDFLNKN